jgi:hypothetical protein
MLDFRPLAVSLALIVDVMETLGSCQRIVLAIPEYRRLRKRAYVFGDRVSHKRTFSQHASPQRSVHQP